MKVRGATALPGLLTGFLAQLLAAGTSAAQLPSGPELGRQVLTGAEIRRAGITQLAEIPLLADDWDVNTVDGFTWRASPRGLTSFRRQNWTVTLDGQRIPLGPFGVHALNRLPVALTEIDSVVLISRPALHAGEFSDAGALHFYTSDAPPDLSLHAHFATGNETGDPGPFRFTRFTTPNVDKDPADFAGNVSFGRPAIAATAGGARRRYFPTDPAIRRRIRALVGRFPILEAFLGWARLQARGLGGTHTARFGYSEFDDFLFLEPVGREIPAERRLLQIGADGTVASGSGPVLDYRASYSEDRMTRRRHSREIDPDWHERRGSGDLRLSQRVGQISLHTGAGLTRVELDIGDPLTDDGFTLGRIHGAAQLGDAALGARLAGLAAVSGGRVGWKAEAAGVWRPHPRHSLELALAWAERTPEEDDRIWYWVRRGSRLPERLGVEVRIDDPERESRILATDLAWSSLTGPLRVRLSAYHRSFADLEFFDVRFTDGPGDSDPVEPVEPGRLVGDQDGSVGGAGLALSSRPVERLRLRGSYRYQEVLTGDPAFRENWETVPRHRVNVEISYRPVPSFGIQARLHGRDATTWAAYRELEAAADDDRSARVPGSWSLDLAADKWFWSRRLRANLMLRNVLDDGVRYHPIGATQSLAIFVQAELRLDSL